MTQDISKLEMIDEEIAYKKLEQAFWGFVFEHDDEIAEDKKDDLIFSLLSKRGK